jgi:hypothetical protein
MEERRFVYNRSKYYERKDEECTKFVKESPCSELYTNWMNRMPRDFEIDKLDKCLNDFKKTMNVFLEKK